MESLNMAICHVIQHHGPCGPRGFDLIRNVQNELIVSHLHFMKRLFLHST